MKLIVTFAIYTPNHKDSRMGKEEYTRFLKAGIRDTIKGALDAEGLITDLQIKELN